MAAATQTVSGGAPAPPGASPTQSPSMLGWIFRILVLGFIDAITIWLVYQMLDDGYFPLAVVLGFVTIWINVIFLVPRYYPLRWLSPGLALMILMVVYPILFTVFVSFTNYGQGHLVTQQIALDQILSEAYVPPDAPTYQWTAFKNAAGEYMLWMTDPATGEHFTVTPGGEPVTREGDPPTEVDGYTQVPTNQLLAQLGVLSALMFGVPPDDAYQISQQQLGVASRYEPKYTHDSARDVVVDNQTGVEYKNVYGVYTSDAGEKLSPGSASWVGLENYQRLLTDPSLRSTFVIVFLWTVAFAFISVLLTFVLGMFLAIMFDVPEMPAKRLLRSLLLIPYTIPAFVAVPVWVGLLNPQFGVISQAIGAIFGWIPPWFSDPFWAKVGVLTVQLWLGFPYMFLIVTGALQTLPNDVYEAADLDGANAWHKFQSITLPLLLVTVGPLLVASFAFNFNNFTVIDLYNRGGPPIPNTPTPVGYTDILATYTYRIAFGSTGRSDYGYASAITVIIFMLLMVITVFQFRFTNMMEERSKNV